MGNVNLGSSSPTKHEVSREFFGEMSETILEKFLEGKSQTLWYVAEKGFRTQIPALPMGLLSGSFAPLHEGHRTLRIVAEQILASPVFFELSISNAEKPSLRSDAVIRRCLQFEDAPVVFTHEARFDRKSLLFPKMVFVAGIDTAIRICNSYFYGSNPANRDDALELLEKQGCRFLIAGRKIHDRFVTVANLKVESRFRSLFEEIPEEKYRVDLSSTELRER